MQDVNTLSVPRTTTEAVFAQLHEEIVTLKLLPGSKISEAEVAARLGVSRQPVRDAFNRLANQDLLSIRPQRATIVCGFSQQKIANARFVRLAVELEVIRQASAVWDEARAAALDENVTQQSAAIEAGEISRFHALDYEFHKLIFTLGGHPLAFETIMQCKQQVDRLCVLSLAKSEEAAAVLADHRDIAHALAHSTPETVETLVRRHLSRLDSVIADIQNKHSEYFE